MNSKEYEVELSPQEVAGEHKPNPKNVDLRTSETLPNDEEAHEEYSTGKHFLRDTHEDDHQENDLIEIHPHAFPEIPLKVIFLTLFLFLAGIGFTIAGISCYFGNAENVKTITFLLFGIFLSIPGCYYGVFLIQAYRAETPEEREEILDQIPV